MEISPWIVCGVCAMVFVASFMDSIAGGGGLISLPAYLLAGLPPVLAAGTNKFSACIGTLTAAYRFGRKGKVIWKTAIPAAIFALPGSYAGAQLLQLLPENTARIIMLVTIPVAALVIFLRGRFPARKVNTTQTASDAQSASDTQATAFARFGGKESVVGALIGLAIGFYDGLVGPGTGAYLIIAFTALLGMGEVAASGTAKIVNLASNAAALVSMLMGGHVVFALGIPAAVCSVLGGALGSGMAIKGGAKVVRGAVVVVLAMLVVKLAWDIASGV